MSFSDGCNLLPNLRHPLFERPAARAVHHVGADHRPPSRDQGVVREPLPGLGDLRQAGGSSGGIHLVPATRSVQVSLQRSEGKQHLVKWKLL